MRKKSWMSGKEFEAALIRLKLENWTEAAALLDVSYRQLVKMRRGERPVEKQTRDLLQCWLSHGVPKGAK